MSLQIDLLTLPHIAAVYDCLYDKSYKYKYLYEYVYQYGYQYGYKYLYEYGYRSLLSKFSWDLSSTLQDADSADVLKLAREINTYGKTLNQLETLSADLETKKLELFEADASCRIAFDMIEVEDNHTSMEESERLFRDYHYKKNMLQAVKDQISSLLANIESAEVSANESLSQLKNSLPSSKKRKRVYESTSEYNRKKNRY